MLSNSLSGKKILVTGGAGFLGSHLLPQILGAGATPYCLVRQPASASKLPSGAIPIYGDCLNLEDMQTASAGCDMLLHMAGMLFGSSWQAYLQANATMAQNIAKLLAGSGIRQIVYVSSLAAAGPCARRPGRDETMPPAPVSAYGWSKLASEQILQNAISSLPGSARLAILRPAIIYGSGDKGLLPLFKSCRRGIGISPGVRKFPVSIVHAKDAAAAVMLALAGENAHGVYHVSDGLEYDMEEICQAMGRACGRKHVLVLKPPLGLMAAVAACSDLAQATATAARRLAGKNPPRPMGFNRDKWREAAQNGWLANNAKITAELGFKPAYDLAAGMEEAVTGYRQMEML